MPRRTKESEKALPKDPGGCLAALRATKAFGVFFLTQPSPGGKYAMGK